MFKYRKYLSQRLVLLALAMCACCALSHAPARAGLLDKLEWKTEKHFGKATKEQLREEYGFVDNPLLNEYVQGMGESLSGLSHRTDIPYEFHVLDTGEVNAFAAPGGFVFVTRGLLEEVESDDELAAVIGHEVGHVAAHHGAKNIKKLPFLIAGLSILNAQAGETTARIGGMVLSMAQLHYSRVDEYQADELGVQYTYKSGYDPHAMASFFQKLESKHRSGDLSKLEVSLMSHPKTTSRMMRIAGYPEMSLNDPAPLVRIGDSYRERFLYRQAEEKYRAALNAAPDHTPALTGLGLCALETGRHSLAREYLDRALALQPDNSAARAGLEQMETALAAAPGAVAAQIADAAETMRARDALALAVMNLEDRINQLHEDSGAATEQSSDISARFMRDVEEYARTANAISEYDEDRVNALYGAAAVFSGLLDELSEVERLSGNVVLLAEESLKRGRIALFRLDRGPVTAHMPASALQLAEAINGFHAKLDGIRDGMTESLETSAMMYQDADRAMQELRDIVLTQDTGDSMGSMRAMALSDKLALTKGRLTEMRALTDRSREQVDATGIALRQASLNLDTLLLSVNDERIFRNMFARRFKLDANALDRLLALGYGFGDAALIQSRARQRGDDLAALLNEDGGQQTIEKLLGFPAANSSAGESILLSFAEMDLRHLLSDGPAMQLEPAGDDPVLARLATPANEPLVSGSELAQAFDFIKAGNPDAARELLQKRGQDQPATAVSHKLLGLAYKHSGYYDEARDEFKNASKRFPEDPQCHFLWANTFQELERYEDALNEYRTTLQMDPDNGYAHLGAGYVLAMMGRAREAEEEYRSAIAHEPSAARAHRNLGLLLYSQGRFYEALAEFEASLKAEPGQTQLAQLTEKLRG